MTVFNALREGRARLTAANVPDAESSAVLLLADVVKVEPGQLLTYFDQPLRQEQINRYHHFLERRAAREPASQIIGTVPFCGLSLRVSKDVLTPRPETEELVALVIDYLKKHPECEHVLDIGTGSGAIALSLAAWSNETRRNIAITATDVSLPALEVARDNARRNNLHIDLGENLGGNLSHNLGRNPAPNQDASRLSATASPATAPPAATVRFVREDIAQTVIPENAVIVANLPYIPSARLQELDPEVRDFEPLVALDGGADGLDCYRTLFARAAASQTPTRPPVHIDPKTQRHGWPQAIFGEIDESHTKEQIQKALDTAGLNYRVAIRQDLAGLNRFFTASSPQE